MLDNGVLGPLPCSFCGCVGVGPGRSGVVCDENFELRLFIHDDRLDPGLPPSELSFSVLGRLSMPGRFGSGLLWFGGTEGDVDEKALVLSLAGASGVDGVTLGGDGSFCSSVI